MRRDAAEPCRRSWRVSLSDAWAQTTTFALQLDNNLSLIEYELVTLPADHSSGAAAGAAAAAVAAAATAATGALN